MTTVTNIRSRTLEILSTGQTVKPDESVDIDDPDLAAALLAQVDTWAEGTPKRRRRKASASASTTTTDAADVDLDVQVGADLPEEGDE